MTTNRHISELVMLTRISGSSQLIEQLRYQKARGSVIWKLVGTGTSSTRQTLVYFDGIISVSMRVVSVSSFLPSSTEDNNATFTGLSTRGRPKLTPVEEARLRVEDAELQREDASNRNVVWDADADADEDALGEDISEEGIVLARCNGSGAMVPIGVRDEGKILPIPVHEDQGKGNNVVEYGGHPDPTPTHVGYLVSSCQVYHLRR